MRSAMSSSKSQAAMEYLTTYGWAILIIAVVLASLYQFGIFNPNYFVKKANPGTCSVIRPYGPFSGRGLSLSGVCNNEQPLYVASSSTFGWVQAPFPKVRYNAFTISGWLYEIPLSGWSSGIASIGTFCGVYVAPPSGSSYSATFDTCNCQPAAGTPAIGCFGHGSVTPPTNAWTFVALSVSQTGNMVLYAYYPGGNQTSVASVGQSTYTNPDGTITLGAYGGSGYGGFYGMMSNVQIYSAALSSADIKSLYLEGIGGVPIDLNDLVGWWPLNGDANDYSGNGNNGTAFNVIFSTSWYGDYAAPK